MPQRRRGEQLRCDGGPADLQKTKGHRTELQQQSMLACENNSVTKHSKSNEGRQGKNGGVKAVYIR